MSYGLSKTKILNGLQCPKRLWLEVHQPELAHYSENSAQLMRAGNEVHKAYRELVPGGILVEYVDDLNATLKQIWSDFHDPKRNNCDPQQNRDHEQHTLQ